MPRSQRLEEALVYAAAVHADQHRKGGDIPYLTHLLAVAALVGEHGGTEDQFIAALLHDAPEDQGGRERLADIEARFGPAVARIVEACTDTFDDPKPPWRPRKEAYIAHLAHADPAALLVSAADKLHNARTLLEDLRESGVTAFDRFNGKQTGTLWYYRALVDAFRHRAEVGLDRGFTRLLNELDRIVQALHSLSDEPTKPRTPNPQL